MRSAEPNHYDADSLTLHGIQCRDCGRVAFPAHRDGCERCGGLDLDPIALRGRGVVQASAVVHRATGGLEAPFTIATIALDDGPTARMALENPMPPTGTRATAVAHMNAENVAEIRFTREEP